MSGDGGQSDPEIDVQKRIADDPDVVWKALFRHYRPTKPLIAAVEGVAIAGGTEILQAMEIRVAGESARFGVSEARWSLYPMGGSAVRLPRQIPYTHAAEILLTGKHIRAREALAIGLVGHVVPDGQALAKAREIAAVICENGPLAVEALTRTLHETDGMELDAALRHESGYGQAVFASEDAKEGPRAFAEKRKPVFQRRGPACLGRARSGRPRRAGHSGGEPEWHLTRRSSESSTGRPGGSSAARSSARGRCSCATRCPRTRGTARRASAT